jgi:hypothetical protein
MRGPGSAIIDADPPMQWTAEQALAAAPDGQVAAAGKKLAHAKHWLNLGRDDDAAWGECQGSAVYQVRVSLADLSSRCSCPSRKFPCKHAIGLMVLGAGAPLPVAEKPEWVASWLAKREDTAAKKTKPPGDRKPDPEAQARRAATRHERVGAGLDALDLWMADLVRNGLAEMETKSPAIWEQQAARLVDAQAPGLAVRLRRLANLAGASRDWAERLLGGLGRLALLTHAYRRLDRLRPELQADVRAAIGWTMTEDEVRATGATVSDRWLVLGSIVEDDERVRAQRTWLRGEASGRTALILQFAAGAAPFGDVLMAGSVIEADLLFWPSAYPQRALIAARRQQTNAGAAGAHPTLLSFLDAAADALAAQPWLWRIGAAVDGVIPAVDARGNWTLRDRDGRALPLEGRDHWRLLAISGGAPAGVTVEWDGHALTPLCAVVDGVFHRLARAH